MILSDSVCLLEWIYIYGTNDHVLFCIYFFLYIFLTCIVPLTRVGFWLVNASWADQGFSAGPPRRSSSPALFIHFIASLLVPDLAQLRKRFVLKVYIRSLAIWRQTRQLRTDGDAGPDKLVAALVMTTKGKSPTSQSVTGPPFEKKIHHEYILHLADIK